MSTTDPLPGAKSDTPLDSVRSMQQENSLWLNINEAYSISRNFAHAMHKKRENLLKEKEKSLFSLDDETDNPDNSVSNLIIRLYGK